jgi:hypothetical protein
MRVERTQPGALRVVLSRRNLLSLLAKLDGNPAYSACTIGAPAQYTENVGVHVYVTVVDAEDNPEHYSHPEREAHSPGPMHPATEAALRRIT